MPVVLLTIALVLKIFPSVESLAPIQWVTAKISAQPAPSVTSAPTELTWDDVIALQDAIGSLPSCNMKLSADSSEAQNIRNILRRTITEIKSCAIYDSKIDDGLDFSPNVDATPTPTKPSGLIVRWNKDTQPFGINVFNALASRFKAIQGHTMPSTSPPNLIWIEVNGFAWKP